MAEVSFYHLERQNLSDALAQLLEKASQASLKSIVRVSNLMLLSSLDKALWENPNDSFLPHATAKDKFSQQQPVILTEKEENPNQATLLFVINDAEFAEFEKYDRVFYIFEGQNQLNVEHARTVWKKFRDQGVELKYWQQGERGNWQLKAS